MDSKGGLIGRLAQLQNLVSRPELNGAYVIITGYFPRKDRFSVKGLPHANADAESILVKEESLQLSTANYFSMVFPNPPEVKLNDLKSILEETRSGTVLRVANLRRSDRPYVVPFTKSHRITGTKVALSKESIPEPITRVIDLAILAPKQGDVIFEFEDIRFESFNSTEKGSFLCAEGRRTTFRRCSFHNVLLVVAGSDPVTNPLKKIYGQDIEGSPHVVLENCLFEANTSVEESAGGIIAGNDGTIGALNCTFRNCETGVTVTEKGHASLIHCTFTNCETGVQVKERAIEMKMMNCVITSCSKNGIALMRSGGTEIKDCRVENCAQCGILIKGGTKPYNLQIENCHFACCLHGIFFEMGKIEARIVSTTIIDQGKYGVHVNPSVMGSVALNSCNISNCGVLDLVNVSQAQCSVTVDGVPLLATQIECLQPKSLHARRCYQEAGLMDIMCARCGSIEDLEKFKKCGRCENVCYCSRECQKAHWKEHKKECIPIVPTVILKSYIENKQEVPHN